MTLIPWNHFNDLDKFFEEDWPLRSIIKEDIETPAMNLYETDKDIVVELSVPGVKPENINVSISNGVLHMTGHSEEEAEEKGKGYYRKEIRKGSFKRSLRLPENIASEKVEAKSVNGLLKISIPKTESPKNEREIKVHSE